jgi:hypothetical protein
VPDVGQLLDARVRHRVVLVRRRRFPAAVGSAEDHQDRDVEGGEALGHALLGDERGVLAQHRPERAVRDAP